LPTIVYSEEILIEEKRRNDLQAQIKKFQDDIKTQQDANRMKTEAELKEN
jgi:hypothetical protein